MRRITIIAGFVISSLTATAHAANFTCRGSGPCVCTESAGAKAVLGYNATDDRMSVPVAITCINMNTMQVAYYTKRKEEGLGATYTSVPVPHD